MEWLSLRTSSDPIHNHSIAFINHILSQVVNSIVYHSGHSTLLCFSKRLHYDWLMTRKPFERHARNQKARTSLAKWNSEM